MNMIWVWPIWLVFIAVSFAGFETYALASGQTTLSRFVWELSEVWKPFPWFVGFLTGFLVCHFWWGGSVTFAPVGKAIKNIF